MGQAQGHLKVKVKVQQVIEKMLSKETLNVNTNQI